MAAHFLIAICANCYIIAYEIVCWRVCTIMQKQGGGERLP